MNLRFRITVPILGIWILLAAWPAFSENKFHLKPDAKGKVCLVCHVAFKEKLSLPFIHTPVKAGDCSDCHNPHTSGHGKLMASDPGRICNTCHGGIVPEKAQSVHKVVVEGNCVKCHDPHAAANRFNLRFSGNELCNSCHKDIAEAVAGGKFKHSPVGKGCLNCHSPHASAKSVKLLKNSVPSLCTGCHDAGKPAFAKRHQEYSVGKSNCTSCHDPHGSNRGALMWANVHVPVVNKMCNQCHQDPSSPQGYKPKIEGYELCRGCHNNMMNETFGRNRIHWPLVDQAACFNCHNPHASKSKGLLKGPMKSLCGTCHQDVVERQEKSLVKHEPIAQGSCTTCHSPHSSGNVFMLDNTTVLDLCGTCHNWRTHTNHPLGGKVTDPRNRNLGVDCLSCHRSHGTDQKFFAYFNPKMDLCVQCHVDLKR